MVLERTDSLASMGAEQGRKREEEEDGEGVPLQPSVPIHYFGSESSAGG